MWSVNRIYHENNFHEKCGGETSPRPFSDKLQLNIYLWINGLKVNTVCFCCMPSWGLSKYIETEL